MPITPSVCKPLARPQYQWKRNEIDIPDSNSSTLTISGFNLQNEGVYRCEVSNSGGVAKSSYAAVFLIPPTVTAAPFEESFIERSTQWGTCNNTCCKSLKLQELKISIRDKDCLVGLMKLSSNITVPDCP